MRTTDLISSQKETAKSVIDTLKPHGFNLILAGGAVRDWFHQAPAKDLDFFIEGEPRPDALRQIFREDFKLLGDEKYGGLGLEVFEANIQGHTCQFIFLQSELTPEEHVSTEFPASICKCWYDGEEFHYHREFKIGERYNVIVIYETKMNNYRYHSELLQRYGFSRRVYPSLTSFLKRHFKKREDVSFFWEADEAVGF